MKKFISTLLLFSFITGCSSSETITQPIINQENVSSESVDKNAFEKFEGYFKTNKNNDIAEMVIKVISITGKVKYDTKTSAFPFELLLPTKENRTLTVQRIIFGKDGNLYAESYDLLIEEDIYFSIGKYNKNNLKEGNTVDFRLDKGIKLDYIGRGLNPMNHEKIKITSKTELKPVKKTLEDFIK